MNAAFENQGRQEQVPKMVDKTLGIGKCIDAESVRVAIEYEF